MAYRTNTCNAFYNSVTILSKRYTIVNICSLYTRSWSAAYVATAALGQSDIFEVASLHPSAPPNTNQSLCHTGID